MFSATTTRHNHHILIVEPDPLFRLLLCAAMAGEFSDFHAVATYNEARALFAEHDFAAIIAENDLAGGSGLSLYDEVRRFRPELPFVLMCGGITATRDDPQFRFFAKPFSVAELTATLVEMIAFVCGR
jgi:DNA-binding NtrC family response regulator